MTSLVIKLLEDDATVGGIMADRIYPVVFSEKTDPPFAVVRLTSVIPTNAKDTDDLDDALDQRNFDVILYSEDYNNLDQGEDAIRDALEGYAGTETINSVVYNIQNIVYSDTNDQFEETRQLYSRPISFEGWRKR